MLSLISLSAFSVDDDPLTALLKKLDEFTKKFPQEKVYLHLDKPYYGIGDDIWFKAYVVDSKTTAPTLMSNILYVELIGEDNLIKKKLQLSMQNGITWGDFRLTDTLSEGNYRIRAYTQLMRSAGPLFFFDKTILVGNNWANKVFANTQFSLIKLSTGNRIKANILVTDTLQKAMANREVIYEIQNGEKNTLKGKGKTNEGGHLSLDFPDFNDQQGMRKIKLTITIDRGKNVIKHIPIKFSSVAIDLQFFPEGGRMVDGITSKIAFKAINAQGLGQNIQGSIVDSDGVEITKFESSYLGMGSFLLNPMSNKTYRAIFKLSDGTEQQIALPKAEKSGYVLMAYDLDSATIGVKISISPELLNQGSLTFVSHHNGKPYTVATIPTTEKASLITLQRNELPSGILQIALFSPSSHPICERLVFINNPNDLIKFQLQNLKPTYVKRQEVNLSFLTTSEKAIWADFSVAVTNSNVVAPDLDNETNILTSLLLTSDLTGYVEKPNHYFLKNDAQTKAELDNLLLTQGWRKINWAMVKEPKTPEINFEAEKNLQIKGSLLADSKPMVKSKITLLSKSNGLITVDTLSNENGQFLFKELSFPDPTKFVLQVKLKKEKNVKILIDSIPQQAVTAANNFGDFEVNVNEKLRPYLQGNIRYLDELTKKGQLNRTIQLKEVNIVGQAQNAAKNSANLNGPGNADYVLDATNLTSATPLDVFLQGKVAGITLYNGFAYNRRKTGNLGSSYRDKKGKDKIPQDTMSLVIDGIFMDKEFNIREVNTDDIESVEVLLSTSKLAVYGGRSVNGIILITTKRGKPATNIRTDAPGVITYFPKGYNVPREFYSPKYEANVVKEPDLRNTIFWRPNLIVDEKGNGKFSYFNSDQEGVYRIVIEGIDAFGNLARKVYTYEVK